MADDSPPGSVLREVARRIRMEMSQIPGGKEELEMALAGLRATMPQQFRTYVMEEVEQIILSHQGKIPIEKMVYIKERVLLGHEIYTDELRCKRGESGLTPDNIVKKSMREALNELPPDWVSPFIKAMLMMNLDIHGERLHDTNNQANMGKHKKMRKGATKDKGEATADSGAAASEPHQLPQRVKFHINVHTSGKDKMPQEAVKGEMTVPGKGKETAPKEAVGAVEADVKISGKGKGKAPQEAVQAVEAEMTIAGKGKEATLKEAVEAVKEGTPALDKGKGKAPRKAVEAEMIAKGDGKDPVPHDVVKAETNVFKKAQETALQVLIAAQMHVLGKGKEKAPQEVVKAEINVSGTGKETAPKEEAAEAKPEVKGKSSEKKKKKRRTKRSKAQQAVNEAPVAGPSVDKKAEDPNASDSESVDEAVVKRTEELLRELDGVKHKFKCLNDANKIEDPETKSNLISEILGTTKSKKAGTGASGPTASASSYMPDLSSVDWVAVNRVLTESDWKSYHKGTFKHIEDLQVPPWSATNPPAREIGVRPSQRERPPKFHKGIAKYKEYGMSLPHPDIYGNPDGPHHEGALWKYGEQIGATDMVNIPQETIRSSMKAGKRFDRVTQVESHELPVQRPSDDDGLLAMTKEVAEEWCKEHLDDDSGDEAEDAEKGNQASEELNEADERLNELAKDLRAL